METDSGFLSSKQPLKTVVVIETTVRNNAGRAGLPKFRNIKNADVKLNNFHLFN